MNMKIPKNFNKMKATEQEAWDIARELDGGGFTPLKGWDGDWHISMVQELREAA
jgi:hypothetical protein